MGALSSTLTKLDLSGNYLLEGGAADLTSMSSLSLLTELNLSYNCLFPEGVNELSSLRVLSALRSTLNPE